MENTILFRIEYTVKQLPISDEEISFNLKNKTSIVFSTPHKAVALYNVLGVFDKFKLNMTKIESRPSQLKQWEYVFFIDFEGYIGDSNVKKAVGELKKRTSFLKILGSYPRAAIPGATKPSKRKR